MIIKKRHTFIVGITYDVRNVKWFIYSINNNYNINHFIKVYHKIVSALQKCHEIVNQIIQLHLNIIL